MDIEIIYSIHNSIGGGGGGGGIHDSIKIHY